MTAQRKVSRFYAANQVLKGHDGRFYFCKKVELINGALGVMCRVVGAKVDVTESVEATLKPKKKAKSR